MSHSHGNALQSDKLQSPSSLVCPPQSCLAAKVKWWEGGWKRAFACRGALRVVGILLATLGLPLKIQELALTQCSKSRQRETW